MWYINDRKKVWCTNDEKWNVWYNNDRAKKWDTAMIKSTKCDMQMIKQSMCDTTMANKKVWYNNDKRKKCDVFNDSQKISMIFSWPQFACDRHKSRNCGVWN